LVVDDDEDARDLLRVVLACCDLNVHVASSANEALAVLGSKQIDLIVSDIGMPEDDGYSLIRAIRALPGSKAVIPALALTAFASNEHRTQALLEGFNAHMTKPVEPAELLQLLVDMVPPVRKTD
jgi:CheY-like chemotaxis protein